MNAHLRPRLALALALLAYAALSVWAQSWPYPACLSLWPDHPSVPLKCAQAR